MGELGPHRLPPCCPRAGCTRLPPSGINRELEGISAAIRYPAADRMVHSGGQPSAPLPCRVRRAGVRSPDLPLEQPTKSDLCVNLKTARALGLTIPQSILQQATELIQ